jgi:hypothetical protein
MFNKASYISSWVVCLILVLFFSINVVAQETPHEEEAVETGTITGTLLKDSKTPLPGATVILEILRGQQLVLTIPKQTDQKGRYQFKNIFQTPDFSYAISTKLGAKVFRTEFVSLGKDEKSRKLDLVVGAGGKEGQALPSPMPPAAGMSSGQGREPHVHKTGLNEYQMAAIVLSILAAAFAIYQRRKKNLAQ